MCFVFTENIKQNFCILQIGARRMFSVSPPDDGDKDDGDPDDNEDEAGVTLMHEGDS